MLNLKCQFLYPPQRASLARVGSHILALYIQMNRLISVKFEIKATIFQPTSPFNFKNVSVQCFQSILGHLFKYSSYIHRFQTCPEYNTFRTPSGLLLLFITYIQFKANNKLMDIQDEITMLSPKTAEKWRLPEQQYKPKPLTTIRYKWTGFINASASFCATKSGQKM